jgi:hypothetical protein
LHLEYLEGRALLAATVYTVTNTSGLADISGSLPNALSQADGNTDPGGSIIQFSQSVFNKQQAIELRSTLMLTNSMGPIIIDGPGATLLTVSGNNAVGVLQIAGGVTATLSGASFTQPVVVSAADVTLASARGIQYGPVTITGMGTSFTIMFARPIDKADRVTLAITIPQADTFT